MSQAILEDRRLQSWKEIAAYFGHDQRTVKRWEHSRGLPVRRLPGARGQVFAMVSEVEAWQRGEFSVATSLIETEEEAPTPVAELEPAESLEFEQETFHPSSTSHGFSQVSTTLVAAESRRPTLSRVLVMSALGTVGLLGLVLRFALPMASRSTVNAQQVSNSYVPAPRAKELYLEGRFRWSKRTPEDLKAAMEDFQQAAALDPKYAAAYAGMADCYALAPQFGGQYEAKVLPQMLAMAHKALMLDPYLPEGHRALGFANFYWRWDREGSRSEFEKAITLAPQDAVAHLWYANTLATQGLSDRAFAELERARELDPSAPAIIADRGWMLWMDGRMEEARSVLERLQKTNPENSMAPLWLSTVALDEHKPQEFLKQYELYAKLNGSAPTQERLAVAERGFRAGGEVGMRAAMVRLTMARADAGQLSPFSVAQELTNNGRNEEALAYLRKAVADRDVSIEALTNPRSFAALRGKPEFEAMVRQVQQPLPDTTAEQTATASLRLRSAWASSAAAGR